MDKGIAYTSASFLALLPFLPLLPFAQTFIPEFGL